MKRKIVYMLIISLALFGVAYAVDMKGDYKFVGPTVDFTNTTVTGISSTSAHTAIVTITAEDSTTNTVTDYITTSHTTDGTVASGFGTGIAFDMEDAGGTEEQGRIDVALSTVTDGSEDAFMDFKINSGGTISRALRIQGANSATGADSFIYQSTTTEDNAVEDMFTYTMGVGSVSAANAGIGITWNMPDGTGNDAEEIASLDVVITDATAATNDTDFVFSHSSAGSVVETLRLIGNSSATTGDELQITSSSTETNAVLYPLVLKQSGGTTVAGANPFGVGIKMQAEMADGVETACTMEAVWTDVGTGSEDADFVVQCADAGTPTEVFRVNSDGQIETSRARTITAVNTAAALLTTADCGATIFLNHATVAIDSVLPAVTGSNGCEFTWVQMLASAVDNTIQTDSGEDKIVVQFFIADGNAGAAADVNADTVTYNNAADAVGDTCRAVSNGLFWHMQCNGAANGAFSSSTT